MAASLDQLRALVERHAVVPPEEWDRLASMLQERDFPRHRHLLRIGEVSGELAFITRGLVRRYAQSARREVNVALLREGSLADDLTSLVEQRPSALAIQALEDTHLLTLPYGAARVLGEGHPCWYRVGLAATAAELRRETERAVTLLALSAAERYARLLEAWPDVELRVPQYHIASYLGVSPETLSRLRRRSRRSSESGC